MSEAYKTAGVDIEAQEEGLRKIKSLVRSTSNPLVLSEVGSFGGLFRLPLEGMTEPVLVASADGVGTKLTVARMAGDYSTVGRDLVNHCVNDILVQGGRPLFFMDYVGAGVLEPASMVALIDGVAAGCRENECALLGGETAEMPGFYSPGDYELVGFIVGVVDRTRLLDGSRVAAGDVLIALPSGGLHTNGYSLARHVMFEQRGLALTDELAGTGRSVRDHLLSSHVSYWPVLRELLGGDALHALAHITGGGLTDNVPRVLPKGCAARVRLGTWEVPEIFLRLEEWGNVAEEEMFRVFNMGVGMVAIVAPDRVQTVLQHVNEKLGGGERAWVLGEVTGGAGSAEPVVEYCGRDA